MEEKEIFDFNEVYYIQIMLFLKFMKSFKILDINIKMSKK